MDHSTHEFPPLPDTDSWTLVRDEDDEETFDDGSRLILKPEDEGWLNYEVEAKVLYAKVAASVVLEQEVEADDQKVPEALPTLVSDEEDVTSDVTVVSKTEEPSELAVSPNDKISDTEEEEEEEEEEDEDEQEEKAHGEPSTASVPQLKTRVHRRAGSSKSVAKEDEVDSLTTFSEQLVEMHKSPHRTKYENDTRQKRRDKRLQRDLKFKSSISEFGRTPKMHPKQIDHEMQKEWKKSLKGHRLETKTFSGDGYGGRKKLARHDLTV